MPAPLFASVPFSAGATPFCGRTSPGGFACVACAWTKPRKAKLIEICESGGKATAWELTGKTVPLEFFERYSLRELEAWHDHDLEKLGRRTHPLKWDAASDRYRPVAWGEAFAEIGNALRGYDPKRIVFYLCGHASLETAYMYQLFGLMVGSNNFPNPTCVVPWNGCATSEPILTVPASDCEGQPLSFAVFHVTRRHRCGDPGTDRNSNRPQQQRLLVKYFSQSLSEACVCFRALPGD